MATTHYASSPRATRKGNEVTVQAVREGGILIIIKKKKYLENVIYECEKQMVVLAQLFAEPQIWALRILLYHVVQRCTPYIVI